MKENHYKTLSDDFFYAILSHFTYESGRVVYIAIKEGLHSNESVDLAINLYCCGGEL